MSTSIVPEVHATLGPWRAGLLASGRTCMHTNIWYYDLWLLVHMLKAPSTMTLAKRSAWWVCTDAHAGVLT